jgi:hypothetical protein
VKGHVDFVDFWGYFLEWEGKKSTWDLNDNFVKIPGGGELLVEIVRS